MVAKYKNILAMSLCLLALGILDACKSRPDYSYSSEFYERLFAGLGSHGKQTSEELLYSEGGDWRLVEGEAMHSPMESHIQAAKEVNPDRSYVSRKLLAGSQLKDERKRTLILVDHDTEVDSVEEFMRLKTAMIIPSPPIKPNLNAQEEKLLQPEQEKAQLASKAKENKESDKTKEASIQKSDETKKIASIKKKNVLDIL